MLAERRRSEPMLPMSMFSSRSFSGGAVAGGVFNFCLYGTLLVVALVLQGTLGRVRLPRGDARAAADRRRRDRRHAVGPADTRASVRGIPMLGGYVMGALGTVILAVAGSTGPVWLVVTGSVVLGFCSIAMPAMTAVTMSGVDPAHTGLGSGVLNTSRQAGGALGAAVFGTLLASGGAESLTAAMIGPARLPRRDRGDPRGHGSGRGPRPGREPRPVRDEDGTRTEPTASCATVSPSTPGAQEEP